MEYILKVKDGRMTLVLPVNEHAIGTPFATMEVPHEQCVQLYLEIASMIESTDDPEDYATLKLERDMAQELCGVIAVKFEAAKEECRTADMRTTTCEELFEALTQDHNEACSERDALAKTCAEYEQRSEHNAEIADSWEKRARAAEDENDDLRGKLRVLTDALTALKEDK